MNITKPQLLAIMPNAKSRVDTYLPFLNKYAELYGINTPLRWSHFLAQIAHESGELKYTKELASGSAYDTGKLAQRLGNTLQADGDGQKYKGRGLIQLTGTNNYRLCGTSLGKDFINNPTLLEQPDAATESAFWFFCKYAKLIPYADIDDIKTIRKRINGGFNGLPQCQIYLNRAKKVLKCQNK